MELSNSLKKMKTKENFPEQATMFLTENQYQSKLSLL